MREEMLLDAEQRDAEHAAQLEALESRFEEEREELRAELAASVAREEAHRVEAEALCELLR